jgi:pimeloyl-[acyl-carrier protein] methyl ester esterase
MTLHCARSGQGVPLVLVHGWGLHGGIWSDLAAQLAADQRVIVPDLPGHGRSRAVPMPAQLTELAEMMAGVVDEPAVWLGWSLGGLVALAVAQRYPHKVARLMLVGSTPRFVQSPDWPHGMAEPVFREFAAALTRDYRATLMRFLSLQAGSDEEGRALIRRLRGEVFEHGEPAPAALANGLTILERSDLRAHLAQIRVPARVVHGRLDRLTPPGAGEYLAAQLPHAGFTLLDGAGHAPFLSQPQRFMATLREFAP